MCMTGTMSASTCWTAPCLSAAGARDSTPRQAASWSIVFLARGLPHRFWAAGPAARLLLIAIPAGIEDYFREISAATGDDERARIGERYGIRVVPG